MRIYSGYACIRRYIYIRIRIESRPARQKKCSQLLYTPLFFGGNPLAGRAEKKCVCQPPKVLQIFAVSVPSKIHLFFMFIAFEGLFTASR